MDFNDLKKQMEMLDKNIQENKPVKETYQQDERIFKPKPDSAGNIQYDVRFLPQLDFSKPPYIENMIHFIKKNGKYFVCNCLNNKLDNGTCKACEKVSNELWPKYNEIKAINGNGTQEGKDVLDVINNYKQLPERWVNIYINKSPSEPEKEGKVLLYNMSKVIFKKVSDKLFPEDDMPFINIFHPLEGRDFRLKGVTGKGPNDYSSSFFHEGAKPISEDPDKVMEIINKTHDIRKFIDEKKMTEEEITKKFYIFDGVGSTSQKEVTESKPDETTTEAVIEVVSMDDIDSYFND